MIPVAQPSFGVKEKQYLKSTIDSGWISSKGEFIEKFENAFAKKYKVGYAIAVSNGTAALHLALKALDIGQGDEVIVPNFTFISSANAIIHAGAKPVFVDVEKETWNIDPQDIERKITPKTKAILPVHLYGHPANMDSVMKIARKNNLKVIEDCAESQGAKANGSFVGSIGDIGCFSFFGNKIMTTGEGGMCTTNSKKLAEKIRILRSHGMDPKKRYHHPVVGFNYRMTNMQAAVGLGQLESVDKFIAKRDKIKIAYEKNLRGLIKSQKIQTTPKATWASPVCWFYSILVAKNKRDSLMKFLEKNGIETRPFFPPITTQEAYKQYAKTKTPVSEDLAKRGINLPTYFGLKNRDVEKICKLIKEFLK